MFAKMSELFRFLCNRIVTTFLLINLILHLFYSKRTHSCEASDCWAHYNMWSNSLQLLGELQLPIICQYSPVAAKTKLHFVLARKCRTKKDFP